MAASGVSKQQDMQPSHDVLNGIGEILRQTMQSILGIVAKARSTVPGCEADAALTFDVRGYNFEDKAGVDDIVVIQDLLDMNVPSDTFYKELCMMAVRGQLKKRYSGMMAKRKKPNNNLCNLLLQTERGLLVF